MPNDALKVGVVLAVLVAGAVGYRWHQRRQPAEIDPARTERLRAIAARMTPGEQALPDGGGLLRYQLFVPKLVPNERYPLLLMMHSVGGRGSSNLEQLGGVSPFVDPAFQAANPSFVLAPQCPDDRQWLADNVDGPPYLNYELRSRPEGPLMRATIALLDALLAQHPIDPARVYVSGFSMGGSATWDLIMRHPERFAAAVPMSGAADPAQAGRLVGLPIRAFHGVRDTVAPITNSRSMIRAVQQAGGDAALEELDTEHHVGSAMWEGPELIAWLFAQRRRPD